jgi:cytochrome P450
MPNSRDSDEHRIRRRMWDHGFTQKQLNAYEPRVIKLADVLCSRLTEFDSREPSSPTSRSTNECVGQVIDLGSWLDYFMFDVMGDLGFSKAFGLLYDGTLVETLSLRFEEKETDADVDGPRYYSKAIRSGLRLRNIVSHVPWVSPIASYLPMNKDLQENVQKFRALSKKSFQERMAKGTEPDDIFTHILAGEDKHGK